MIHTGDCIEVMRGMGADSVDAVVTDPPYGLEFMGKEWDAFRPKTANRGGKAPGRSKIDPTKLAPVQYGIGGRRSTMVCDGCGKRDKFTNPHSCPDDTGWSRIFLDDDPRHASYGQAFQAWCQSWGTEALRVTRPGGYLLAFGGTRTHHRLVCGLEDAGWIIRDELDWIYASGFPKSMDVSKALDKVNGRDDRRREFGVWLRAQREKVGMTAAEVNRRMGTPQGCGWWEGKGAGEKWDLHLPSVETYRQLQQLLALDSTWDGYIEWAEAEREQVGPTRFDKGGRPIGIIQGNTEFAETAPATDLARKWEGWGTALKPAHEPIVLAQKPKAGSTAANVILHGVGALNIDASRTDGGRWPSNVLLSTPELFDEPNPAIIGSGAVTSSNVRDSEDHDEEVSTWSLGRSGVTLRGHEDTGGYSRFFLVPKSSRADREPVVRGQVEQRQNVGVRYTSMAGDGRPEPAVKLVNRENAHPTVKPVDLMRHLIRLVTPSGGTVLDPFLGSGSTAIAAELEGFPWIGIEQSAEYVAIAEARLNGTQRGLGLDVPLAQPVRKLDPRVIAGKGPSRPEGASASTWFTTGYRADEEPVA